MSKLSDMAERCLECGSDGPRGCNSNGDTCANTWHIQRPLQKRIEELERLVGEYRSEAKTATMRILRDHSKLQRYRELAEKIVKYLPDVQQQLHRLGYETVAVEVSMHIAEARELLKED